MVADDTGVFVLLCHFVNNDSITGGEKMTSSKRSTSAIKFNATLVKHKHTMNKLLLAMMLLTETL